MGLADSGIDLRTADLFVGTSAGRCRGPDHQRGVAGDVVRATGRPRPAGRRVGPAGRLQPGEDRTCRGERQRRHSSRDPTAHRGAGAGGAYRAGVEAATGDRRAVACTHLARGQAARGRGGHRHRRAVPSIEQSFSTSADCPVPQWQLPLPCDNYRCS